MKHLRLIFAQVFLLCTFVCSGQTTLTDLNLAKANNYLDLQYNLATQETDVDGLKWLARWIDAQDLCLPSSRQSEKRYLAVLALPTLPTHESAKWYAVYAADPQAVRSCSLNQVCARPCGAPLRVTACIGS